MKEWILENTDISSEEYDNLINLDTVSIKGKHNPQEPDPIFTHPIIDISSFTLKKDTIFNRIKYKIKKHQDNSNTFYECKKVKFFILSNFLHQLKSILTSKRRLNQCFHLNAKICLMLDVKCYLVTALCQSPYYTNTKKYLHSFILIILKNNKEYIIDGTSNTIIEKNTYFELFQPQIISCIDQKTLKQDLTLIEEYEQEGLIYKAEYYCFKDPIISSIKKRSKIKN